MGRDSQHAINAWADGILRLQEFRQTKYRNPGPGRTNWPEPDSIRDATGCTLPRHKDPINTEAVGTYPKAVLGLPIVFHFKDAPRDATPDTGRDPLDVSLYPDTAGDTEDMRMASPFIVRPMFDSAQGWRPAIFVLPHDHLSILQCRLRSNQATFVAGKGTVLNNQIQGAAVSMVQPLSDHRSDNALDAFLEYCSRNGFAEV